MRFTVSGDLCFVSGARIAALKAVVRRVGECYLAHLNNDLMFEAKLKHLHVRLERGFDIMDSLGVADGPEESPRYVMHLYPKVNLSLKAFSQIVSHEMAHLLFAAGRDYHRFTNRMPDGAGAQSAVQFSDPQSTKEWGYMLEECLADTLAFYIADRLDLSDAETCWTFADEDEEVFRGRFPPTFFDIYRRHVENMGKLTYARICAERVHRRALVGMLERRFGTPLAECDRIDATDRLRRPKNRMWYALMTDSLPELMREIADRTGDTAIYCRLCDRIEAGFADNGHVGINEIAEASEPEVSRREAQCIEDIRAAAERLGIREGAFDSETVFGFVTETV